MNYWEKVDKHHYKLVLGDSVIRFGEYIAMLQYCVQRHIELPPRADKQKFNNTGI